MPAPKCPPLRVLCVDDYPDAAESAAMLLEMLGCEAEYCYRGAAALPLAAALRPDACLLDLDMPGMDGCELARKLRAQQGGRPMLLIALTAHGDRESRARTARAGFDRHLVKPVDVGDLAETLRGFGGADSDRCALN